MHTGKYEKLRFRNICRVCEAAGWAAECPGPRSSPTTAEWRVMRILYPSVSRHSPSFPPTFFILCSHHANSYGHKTEREAGSTVKWEAQQFACRFSGLPSLTFAICPPSMIDNCADINLPASLLLFIFRSCYANTPACVGDTPATDTSSLFIPWILKTSHLCLSAGVTGPHWWTGNQVREPSHSQLPGFVIVFVEAEERRRKGCDDNTPSVGETFFHVACLVDRIILVTQVS